MNSENLQSVTNMILPRRFDVVEWFVRIQKDKADLLDSIYFHLPTSGPSSLYIFNNVELPELKVPYLYSLEKSFSQHPQSQYIESLKEWQIRRQDISWESSSITWLMTLNREAWLTLFKLNINKANNFVKSAWLTLALSSQDRDLILNLPDDSNTEVHNQVYYDAVIRGLDCTLIHKNEEWLNFLKNTKYWNIFYSRLSPLKKDNLNID